MLAKIQPEHNPLFIRCTSMKKRGRPSIPYRTSWGENIDGLSNPQPGRWRILATGQRFTQHDERMAIAYFRKLTGPNTVKIFASVEPRMNGNRREGPTMVAINKFHDALMEGRTPPQVTAGATGATLSYELDSDVVWAWLGQQLREKPAYVAQRVGIEQIGYLSDLPKPTPSPTLIEVGELYFNKAKVTPNWLAKSKIFWREFCASVGVTTLRELTPELIADYRDSILDNDFSPTYARQRFGAIKTILKFPTVDRLIWVEDCSRALGYCVMLKKPAKKKPQPRPISPANFAALLLAADPQMQALLLLALNACMYLGEVIELKWFDIDFETGILSTHRNKKEQIVRVAVLWPETLAALNRLPRLTDTIFLSADGDPHTYQSIYKLWKAVRKEAKLDGEDVQLTSKWRGRLQSSHLRDGSYTQAMRMGKDITLAKLIAGHSTGMADEYVERNQDMVAPVCEAVRRAYDIERLVQSQATMARAA